MYESRIAAAISARYMHDCMYEGSVLRCGDNTTEMKRDDFYGRFYGSERMEIPEQKRFKCALCELVFAVVVAVSGFVISHFTGNILTSIGIF
ncbi:MAG: hypothetical protein LUF30_06660 [Lachnospiraceae bacterium]|nr:hypothetical protein [Lachnospiraceae bacterium]